MKKQEHINQLKIAHENWKKAKESQTPEQSKKTETRLRLLKGFGKDSLK